MSSDADRFFPPRGGKGPRAAGGGQRFIRATDRKSGQSRSVEVVHLRRGTAEAGGSPRAEDRSLRGEAWPDGFRPERNAPPTPFDPPPAPVAKPAPQIGHVVERAPSLLAPLPVQPEAAAPAPRPRGRPRQARSFADPFAADDTGANCLRCGYLIEPAREKRGKLTCAACG
jgi:hypothetical protein